MTFWHARCQQIRCKGSGSKSATRMVPQMAVCSITMALPLTTYYRQSMKKLLLALWVLLFLFAACADDRTSDSKDVATINDTEAATAAPVMQVEPNLAVPMPTPTPQATASGMNPPHGQPGHRCEIAVGAPLSSAPSQPVQTQIRTPTAQPTVQPNLNLTPPAAAPRLPPPARILLTASPGTIAPYPWAHP